MAFKTPTNSKPKEEEKKGQRPTFNLCFSREDENGKSQLITLASLWEKTSQAGNKQYSGMVNSEYMVNKQMVQLPLNKNGNVELTPKEWLNLFIVKQ